MLNLSHSHDVETFTKLFENCQRRLFVYISMLVPNAVDARDVLQDTNLVLWQKFHQFELGTNFLAWAREIARYRILRFQQIKSRNALPIDPVTLEVALAKTEAVCSEYDLKSHLDSCLNGLPVTDRELIQARYTPGISVGIIAARTGRSENAISRSLGRIRKALRSCIQRRQAQSH